MRAAGLNERLAIGMTVFDAAGDKFGTLVGADSQCLIVEKGFFFPTDVSVPMDIVGRVDADGIWLSLTNDDVRQESWAGDAPAGGAIDVAPTPI